MTPRENLISLYRRRGYAWAPVAFDLCPALEQEYRRRYGAGPDYAERFGMPGHGIEGPRLPRRAVDFRRYYGADLKSDATIDPVWGVAHEAGGAGAHHFTHMRHPLARCDSLEQLQAYPWPDFAAADSSHMRGQAEAVRQRGFAAHGWMACTVWETAWYLRSMEALMMDMLEGSPLATFVLDQVTAQSVLRARAFARAGVDVLCLGDDVGMQSSLMMKAECYRDWLKPRLARVIAAARAEKPGLLVWYHSDGNVLPVIDDLIEAGVDILNPVQPESMDFAEVHARWGDRLSFHGTLGIQSTMPFGTPADVRATVQRNLRIAGARGGLFCAPTHMLEPEVPWENIEAYLSACREFQP
jgi:uroporphyrinogen decarboxylase